MIPGFLKPYVMYAVAVVIFGLLLALGASGLKIYFLSQEVSSLKLDAQAQQTAHAVKMARLLKNQRDMVDVLLAEEEKRRAAEEAENRKLLDEVRRLEGYANRLSAALRTYFNGVWARARREFGGSGEALPAGPGTLPDRPASAERGDVAPSH